MSIQSPRKNPGAAWHRIKETEADRLDAAAPKKWLKDFFHGKSVAHMESGLTAKYMGMNPRKRSRTTAYDMAVHYGFSYIVTETEPIIKRGIVFSAFSKNIERSKPWLYVGYNHKTRRWHIFGDQPLAKGIPGIGQTPKENQGTKWYVGLTENLQWEVKRISRPAAQAWLWWKGPFELKQYALHFARHTRPPTSWPPSKNHRRPHGTFRSCVKHVRRSLRHYGKRGDPKRICGASVKRNPIAIYGLTGNPRMNGHVNAKISGLIYNRVIEVKAQKTAFKPGYYRHPFSRQNQVKLFGLDNGDLLLHSTAGVRLWTPA